MNAIVALCRHQAARQGMKEKHISLQFLPIPLCDALDIVELRYCELVLAYIRLKLVCILHLSVGNKQHSDGCGIQELTFFESYQALFFSCLGVIGADLYHEASQKKNVWVLQYV